MRGPPDAQKKRVVSLPAAGLNSLGKLSLDSSVYLIPARPRANRRQAPDKTPPARHTRGGGGLNTLPFDTGKPAMSPELAPASLGRVSLGLAAQSAAGAARGCGWASRLQQRRIHCFRGSWTGGGRSASSPRSAPTAGRPRRADRTRVPAPCRHAPRCVG